MPAFKKQYIYYYSNSVFTNYNIFLPTDKLIQLNIFVIKIFIYSNIISESIFFLVYPSFMQQRSIYHMILRQVKALKKKTDQNSSSSEHSHGQKFIYSCIVRIINLKC